MVEEKPKENLKGVKGPLSLFKASVEKPDKKLFEKE